MTETTSSTSHHARRPPTSMEPNWRMQASCASGSPIVERARADAKLSAGIAAGTVRHHRDELAVDLDRALPVASLEDIEIFGHNKLFAQRLAQILVIINEQDFLQPLKVRD